MLLAVTATLGGLLHQSQTKITTNALANAQLQYVPVGRRKATPYGRTGGNNRTMISYLRTLNVTFPARYCRPRFIAFALRLPTTAATCLLYAAVAAHGLRA